MSQDFSQYDQRFETPAYAPEQPPPRKGCNRGCLFLLILLGLIVAALVGMFIWLVHNIAANMTQDPKEITRRLVERFPTAQAPPGYTGMIGIKVTVLLDMDLLVFGKEDTEVGETGEVQSGDSLILFSFKVPGIKEVEMEEALQAGNNGGKLIEKKQRQLTVGAYQFDGWFQKVLRATEGGEQKLHYQLIVPLGNNTVAVMQKDSQDVDEAALQQFLSTIAKDCPLARKVEK